MVLKNWFWLVILLVAGIKYGTAQSSSIGVVWSYGNEEANYGYGVHIQTEEIGILALRGAFVDESLNSLTVDDVMSNKKIFIGGTYTQFGLTFPRIVLPETPFEIVLGAGGTLRSREYVKDVLAGTEDDYTTWMLGGINLNTQNSNVYGSISVIGDFLGNGNKSLMIGIHYKL